MSPELQMSPVQEKARRLGRTRNLQMPPRRERMFPVNRPAVRRPSAAQERDEGTCGEDIRYTGSGCGECYTGNGGYIRKCSSISFDSDNRADWYGGHDEEGGAAEGATGQGAGSADQAAARELP